MKMEMQCSSQMQQTDNRRFRRKAGDETSGSAEFSGIETEDLLLLRHKLVFFDIKLLNFGVQCGSGNTEFRRRTFGARNFPFAFS
jgi:hypothetical protein